MSDVSDHFEELRDRLTRCGQVHLLKYWTELDESERKRLWTELDSLDIGKLVSDFKSAIDEHERPKRNDAIFPVPERIRSGTRLCSEKQLVNYWEKGLEAIRNGDVAVIVMAGGQGTRLGVHYPKGLYNVGLPSQKSLFELQAQRIIRLKRLAAKGNGKKYKIPWFIMTSDHTMSQTKSFFEKNEYFGLDADDVTIFEQNEIPSFTKDGKIILEDKCSPFKAPDGNGGIFYALRRKGILTKMSEIGVKYVHAYCVDNILVRVPQSGLRHYPFFMGYCVELGADCAVKVVLKEDPNESVGVVCQNENDTFKIVEYSELCVEYAYKKDNEGRLVFRDGNICNHFFSLDFLNRIADGCEHEQIKLTYHPAIKKIPSIDGIIDGFKLEQFVFDVIPYSSKFLIWQVERDEEFEPLKNGPGKKTCSPETCQLAVLSNHKKWLQENKIGIVPQCEIVEISPLVSYAAEGLDSKYINFRKVQLPDGKLALILADEGEKLRVNK